MSRFLTLPEASLFHELAAKQVLAGAFGDDDRRRVGAAASACRRAASNPRSPCRAKGTSGTSVKLTFWLAKVAPAAMKPAWRPMSFTRPIPLGRAFASTWAQYEHSLRLLDGRQQAEGVFAVIDVVVDGLGHADDGDLLAAPIDLLVEGVSAALRAVAADDRTAC